MIKKDSILLFANDISERTQTQQAIDSLQKYESINLLIGGIAHDFNNLIAAVLGNISIAKMHAPSESKVSERLFEAEKASMHLINLTQQLLAFSRGGAVTRKPTNIQSIIQDTTEFSLHGSNVKCEYDFPPDLWPVLAREGQMSQVIQNLIINARQAMPNGGIIELSANNTTIEDRDILPVKPGKYVRITIKDHGTGIPPEHIQKIFKPFFTTKKKGTGLGLATSYSIIQKHHGHISVESEPGTGTIFTIYLPVSESKAAIVKKSPKTLKRGTGTILVVEDLPNLRVALEGMLVELGYTPVFAVNGQKALETLKYHNDRNKSIDAVILDLTTPGEKGGDELLIKLKEINSDIKAIITSGYADSSILQNYKYFGFYGSLSKPYRIEELSHVLSRVISKK